MEPDKILEKITPIFQQVFNDDELEVNMNLSSEDIDEWSSLSQTILLTEIESAFGIRFKLREAATMNNVKNIVSLIAAKLG